MGGIGYCTAMQGLRDKAWRVVETAGLTPERIGGRRRAPLFKQLAAMRADNAASTAPYNAGPIWEDLARRFHRWFALGGIENVENHPMNGQFSSPPPGNPKLLRYACWLLYRDIARRDSLGLLDRVRATATGELAFEFEGRLVSWDLLISLDTLYGIAEVDPRILTEPVVVAELGAGWGRLGHALRLANPQARYVVFDLPEVLLVSQTHLPRRLPSDTVAAYETTRQGPLTRNRLLAADLTFLGAHDLDRVENGAVNIMVNIASFQEMSALQVALYCRVIERVTRGLLYTQQLWNADTHGYGVGEVSGWSAYPWPAHWKTVVSRDATWSDLYFEAVFDLAGPAVDTVQPTSGSRAEIA